jgi:hypothetical protein
VVCALGYAGLWERARPSELLLRLLMVRVPVLGLGLGLGLRRVDPCCFRGCLLAAPPCCLPPLPAAAVRCNADEGDGIAHGGRGRRAAAAAAAAHIRHCLAGGLLAAAENCESGRSSDKSSAT